MDWLALHYYSIYLIFILLLGYQASHRNNIIKVLTSDKSDIQTVRNSIYLASVIILFIGLRPNHLAFGDMTGYVANYTNELLYPRSFREVFETQDTRGEWGWGLIMTACAQLKLPAWCWVLLVAAGYIGIGLMAIKRLFKNSTTYLAFLFFLSAFSFFSYGVNGMRNGLACSITLLAITYMVENNRNLLKFLLYGFIAYHIHNSTLLPLVVTFFASFVLKGNTKFSYIIWICAIPGSLLAHSFFETLLAGLAPDERFIDSISAQYDQYSEWYNYVGFRWDFLIYSFMPILLGYFVLRKSDGIDSTYSLLLNVYMLSNAFWILVINASFSNRFAYLSWFIYPIVIAYPLLELEFSEKRYLLISRILILHILFTCFMQLI